MTKPLVALFPSIVRLWVDGGYAGKLVEWVTTELQRTLAIVKRPRETKGFAVVGWRWIVERTFYRYCVTPSDQIVFLEYRLSLRMKVILNRSERRP